ncbi:MAG: CoB--CoM heterodisulfide reductase iron-sulfur subunit A family protein [Elusimicrobia bacterium]|nr:CoB--CoM heterodisulfide reductase iron-sulfur subunit A family protein [Elusimicrobiota bacterium]
MSRLGVFVCHCGENIGRTVDCAAVAAAAARFPGVVHSVDYKYMCSDPGQSMIKKAIADLKLTGVVVAACSPRMHERTFRSAAAQAGLNPYLLEMANVREHCSWVHADRAAATAKAVELVRLMVEKTRRDRALRPVRVPVEPTAMVVGGGIAGIQAALDIAAGGKKVVLVESGPSIGGHMARLSETFPTLDCSQCILTPRMVEAASHPNIRLMTYAEVAAVEGFVGNFEVTVRRKARFVDPDKCTGCGDCWNRCPQKRIPSEFDAGLGARRAIYVPFPQAVPNKPVIDAERCTMLKQGKCGLCAKVCPRGAVDFKDRDRLEKVKVGAVVLATGFELWDHASYGEYGGGRLADVIDGFAFERLASASGPTGGAIKRPSDGAEPKTVVFIQCCGSRDEKKGLPYCSKICCMYTAKHAMLYRHKVHDGEATVFYMDIRATGKGYEEFVRRAIDNDGARYVRGRVSRVYRRQDGRLVVKGADTLAGRPVTVLADMVVLADAVRPRRGSERLAQLFGVGYDQHGFYSEAHPKLRPVETAAAGVFLAGACQAPKDIPDAVAQASAAAAKTLGLFSQPQLEREPVIARVNRNLCSHCRSCVHTCPYGAVKDFEVKDRAGSVLKVVAEVNEGLCQGCGTCVAVCRSHCIDLDGFTDEQIHAQIAALEAA